jgi:hypothetical protein
MSGATPALPQYALLAWSLVKHRDFTFTFTFTKVIVLPTGQHFNNVICREHVNEPLGSKTGGEFFDYLSDSFQEGLSSME